MSAPGGSVAARCAWAAACAVFVLLASLLAASPAPAADSRADAVAAYQQATKDERVRAGWTGNAKRCKVGRESAASVAATFRTLNTIREFAGLEPVAESKKMSKQALAAAMMMQAKGSLSHSPGRGWPCYSKAGAMGASHSNLCGGCSGPEAIWAYMNEGPDFGHRRWVLFPGAIQMGTGSTGRYNALLTVGSELDGREVVQVPEDNLTAWPAPGYFPQPWIPQHWSLGLGNHDSAESINTRRAEVSVSVDGDPVPARQVESLDQGYGMGKVLGWKVDLPKAVATGDHEIAVSISGVTRAGEDWPITYEIDSVDPASAGG